MVVYLSGPMRGIPGYNFPAFDEAEARWKAAGHHVLSPAQTCRALGYAKAAESHNESVAIEHLKHVMQVDIACIYAADAIALLPGWENSMGCTVELSLAQFLGLKIYCATTEVEMNKFDALSKPWSHLAGTYAKEYSPLV